MAPLVAIGGTLCDERLWQGCLVGPTVQIVAGRLPDGSMGRGATMADHAEELLTALSPRFALPGFSLAGLMALELARASERISRLALICAGQGAESPEGAAMRRHGRPARMGTYGAGRSPGRRFRCLSLAVRLPKKITATTTLPFVWLILGPCS